MGTLMSDDVDAFVRSLARVSNHDYRAHIPPIEEMARNGRGDELLRIAKILAAGEPTIHEWDRENVLDYILSALATSPGLTNAAATLALVEASPTVRRGTSRRDRARQAGSMLARAQPIDVFVALVGRATDLNEPTREALACWAQECVVRGVDLTAHAHVVEFWRSLAATAHPLSRLPLAPLPHESELTSMLPSYAGRSSVTSLPFGPSARRKIAFSRDAANPFASRPPDAPFSTAVDNWTRESNGVVEEKIFSCDRAIDVLDEAVLARMTLECLDDATWVSLQRIDAAVALAMLFAAAATGSAYNRGELGAYGRLHAWTSLVGLALGAADGGLTALAARVEHASFVTFESDGAWFRAVAWDWAIACVREDRTTIAALAATDCD